MITCVPSTRPNIRRELQIVKEDFGTQTDSENGFPELSSLEWKLKALDDKVQSKYDLIARMCSNGQPTVTHPAYINSLWFMQTRK